MVAERHLPRCRSVHPAPERHPGCGRRHGSGRSLCARRLAGEAKLRHPGADLTLGYELLDERRRKVAEGAVPAAAEEVRFEAEVTQPKLWSAETPELYTLLMTVKRE